MSDDLITGWVVTSFHERAVRFVDQIHLADEETYLTAAHDLEPGVQAALFEGRKIGLFEISDTYRLLYPVRPSALGRLLLERAKQHPNERLWETCLDKCTVKPVSWDQIEAQQILVNMNRLGHFVELAITRRGAV